MIRHVAMAAAVLLWAGCKSESDDTEQEAAAVPPAAADMAPITPADTLVATAPGGVEIWLTMSRQGTAADGSTCTDRTIEIRRDTSRIKVPLLYTGEVPQLVNDTTIRARLSNQCIPGDVYLVNLRTGRPVREK